MEDSSDAEIAPVQGNLGQDFGRDLGNTIKNAVGDVLKEVRAGMSKELAAATRERDALQRQLDASKPGAARAALADRVALANAKVAQIQAGIDKIDGRSDLVASTTPAPTLPPPAGSAD